MLPIANHASSNQVGQDAVTSLDILKPRQLCKTSNRRRTPTQSHLEHLGARFIELCNSRDWDDPHWRVHMAPTFVTFTHAVQGTSSREEYVERFKQFTLMNPSNFWEIINLSADVDERKGLATVWMMLKAGGQPNSIQGERVNAIYFQRKDKGVWEAYSGTQITGIGVDF